MVVSRGDNDTACLDDIPRALLKKAPELVVKRLVHFGSASPD
jgi:hypothetical protein